MQTVKLLITDLDDTIWDWWTMWYNSFNPYLHDLVKLTKVEEVILKKSFKKLHQALGSSEYSFAYKELLALNDAQKAILESTKVDEFKSVLHKFNYNKKHNLHLFPEVQNTLLKLKKAGVKIIGFTESNTFFTKYKIKNLGIDGLIDCIYSPESSDLPASVETYYPPDYWETQITEFSALEKGFKKPDPKILSEIIEDQNASPDECIYIGDKTHKDIFMANLASITSVYAKYGEKVKGNKDYELLTEVTHWTDEEVKKEKAFNENLEGLSLSADYEINSFSEILNLFDFQRFVPIEKEQLELKLKCWEKTIDVQKHFNELELRVRNYAITIAGAILGATAFAIKEEMKIELFKIAIPVAAVLVFLAMLIWLTFFMMDRHWYHRLLYGAVKHGLFIENRLRSVLPEIGLSHRIAIESHNRKLFNRYEWTTRQKMDAFYLIVAICLAILTALFYVTSSDLFLADIIVSAIMLVIIGVYIYAIRRSIKPEKTNPLE